MSRPAAIRLAVAATALVVALLAPAAVSWASQTPYVPGEVVVKYRDGTTRTARAATQRATGTGAPAPTAPQERILKVEDGDSVPRAIAQLRRREHVEYAVPNYVARASGFIPNDPGRSGKPGGWQDVQWNFVSPFGIGAPDAWQNLIAAGRPGGQGTIVAVLDSGVAYRDRGRFRRSPDFAQGRFVRGYDFVDDDGFPEDEYGHGTHVAGTIGEQTNNGVAVTGLAYGARIMPVRVLDARGEGDAATIARGIRFAARRGADVVNLSLEFSSAVRAREIPEILSAVRYAHRRGVVLVGAAGNGTGAAVAYPAKASDVVSVGASTEHGCVAEYSNLGPQLDLVAPGGGADASDVPGIPPGNASGRLPTTPYCTPELGPGRDVLQLTLAGSIRRFSLPGGYEGTSMAAPHVAAAAALVIASGVLGRNPSPDTVERRLEATAQDEGLPGRDNYYGAGLLDAAAATRR